MEIQVLRDPRHFETLAGTCMADDPFTTSVIAVHSAGVLDGSRALGDEDIWVVALEGDDVVGIAMHTPPFRLFLARMQEGVPRAIAATLLEHHRRLSGVGGEQQAVREFSDAWASGSGASVTVDRRMRMYRLGRLTPPTGVPGEDRLAGERDRDLVVEWLQAFSLETGGTPRDDEEELAERRMARRELRLWWDDRPVSMAAHSVAAGGVSRVGPVYTPPERRGHGYGSAVTAAVTLVAMEGGAEHVVLYTDLANPTSNAIYQRIGYEADHDAEERGFA